MFNLGIGMVVVVAADDAYRALDVLRTDGHRAAEIGTVEHGDGAGPPRRSRGGQPVQRDAAPRAAAARGAPHPVGVRAAGEPHRDVPRRTPTSASETRVRAAHAEHSTTTVPGRRGPVE